MVNDPVGIWTPLSKCRQSKDCRKKKERRLCKRTFTLYALLASIQSGTENAGLSLGKGNLMVKTFLLCEVEEMSYGGSRKYCRFRWEPLCQVWPEPGRQFAIHSLGLPFQHYRETCLIASRGTRGYRNAPRDQPR
jgi:hypothetical protein